MVSIVCGFLYLVISMWIGVLVLMWWRIWVIVRNWWIVVVFLIVSVVKFDCCGCVWVSSLCMWISVVLLVMLSWLLGLIW